MPNVRLFVPFVLLVALGACAPSPQVREVPQYTIEQFLNTEAIGGGSFSADETELLYASDASGIFNAYVVPVTGGDRKLGRQLTHSTENSVFPLSFFPEDNRMLYSSDTGGNEILHIFLREEDGSVRDLTPGERNRANFRGWARDNQSFFYQSNARDPRFMDLFEMDVATLESRLMFENDGYNIASISPDKRYVTLAKAVGNHDSDIYLHDTQTSETRLLTEHEGDIQHRAQGFASDSTTLYYITNADSDFNYLMKMDINTGESEIVEKPEWDVFGAGFSRNGTYLTVRINQDARNVIHIYDTTTGEQIELPDVPGDIIGTGFSRSEKLMSLFRSESRSPNNLFVYDLETKEQVQITNTLNPEINLEDLVETEVLRYESFDGLEIPAILTKPHLAPGEKAPAIIQVHGGPGGQSRPGYNALYQYLANHGYVVLQVNNRGSSGYGVKFEAMDDQAHGEGDLDDCVWGKKYLQSLDYVDPDRIGILGQSYGGYIVLAAMAFRPDEFAVGVDLFGVANWLRTLENTPAWWAAARDALFQELGDPRTQADYLREISPLFHAENIVKPMLVLQGANDPRVLQVESDEMVAAIRGNGVPVEYIVFDDEGHGFGKKANRITGFEAILTFLDQHLKETAPTSE